MYYANLEILHFLQTLKNNNDKIWFDQNRQWYLQVRTKFEKIVEELIKHISNFDVNILDLKASATIFRINRDLRFSKDKSPYKTNFGAYIAKGGKNSPWAGYYLHYESDEIFLAGGIYKPENEILSAVRWHIYENIDRFLAIIGSDDFKKFFKEIDGQKQIKLPKDFDKNFPHKELLKFKDYNIVYYLNFEEIIRDDFVAYCAEIFRKMYEFNSFINEAISKVLQK